MKQQSIYIVLLFVTSLLGGCTDLDKGNPYEDQLHTLQVTAVYPDEYAEYLREGITVQIEDIDRGNSYKTDNRPERYSAIRPDQRHIPHTNQR